MAKRLKTSSFETCRLEPLEQRTHFAVDVTIDAAQRYQQIDGFGTSMAWWLPNVYEADAWRNTYYQDLGSSMLRVDLNINALPGSDGDLATPVVFGEDLQANIDLFDWNSIPMQRFGGVAQAGLTKKVDQLKVVGSIWSPPNWMKGAEVNPSTGAMTSVMPQLIENTLYGYSIWDSAGGSLIDSADNLQQFGRYVAAYAKGFEQHFGTPMYAVSVANEPAFHEPYSSAVYDPALYVKALKAIGEAFNHYGLTTKIIGPEDVGVGSTTNVATLNRQLKYINAIKADPAANAHLDLYTIHGYADDGITDNRSPAMWAKYWDAIKSDGRRSWMSEISGQSANWAGAITLAASAQDALVQGNASAWLYWQMSDGPTQNSYTLTGGSDTAAPKYNAAKHFFRYIRPGSVRVSATPSDPSGVYVSAFANDASKTLTSVLMNETATAQTVKLSLAGLGVSKFNIARQSTSAAVWTDLGPVTVTGNVATLTLPAMSIVTLQGATSPAPTLGSISGVVWNDLDADSIKDSNEAPISNVKLFLDADKDGVLDASEKTTTTDLTGAYRFSNLAAGSYRVREVKPAGYRITTPSAGYIDITLAAAQSQTAKNFGNTQKALISGAIFNDLDSDGVRDSNEPGKSAWRVYLDANKDGLWQSSERSTFTDASGNYKFTTLAAGSYRVREVAPTGWRRTTPGSGYFDLTLASGGVVTAKNFGNTQNVLITGSVFNDLDGDRIKDSVEQGLANWKVFIDTDGDGILDASEKSVLTDASGNFSFKTLAAGTYKLRVVQQSGWTRTTPTSGYHAITLAAGATTTGKLFGEKKSA